MRLVTVLLGVYLVIAPMISQANCYTPKIARDAIRAIALISDRAMITDLVGGLVSSVSNQDSYVIWANYRNHGYSDKYEVIIESRECRVLMLNLVDKNLPIKEPF
ncbi:MAG: hypothetical protein HQK53_03495 [Oligoflexia bacterium]|nr:hypothetical protein [Oligoflexia bacterium]